ncbi:MAG: hypothetical protein ACRC9V_01065 [Aeromonas sp.]
MTDELYSKNKSAYFTLDFGNVTEKGLKKLVDAFKKAGQAVATVTATNRVIKKDRLSTKKFTLTFETGQSVTVSVGDQGDVIETRLNSTVVPVKALDTMAAYAKEVSKKVEDNQAKYDRSLALKTKRVTDSSSTKPASRSIQARLIEAGVANDAAKSDIKTVTAKFAEAEAAAAIANTNIEDLSRKLEIEKSTTVELKKQLKAAESAQEASR